MSKYTSPLDNVSVAAPCNAAWDNMVGNERVRFCGQCNLNVYNLSAMPKGDAERLIAQAEGRLCVRYYRRADGTILTGNCPVGLRALKRRLSRVASATAAAVLSFVGGLIAATGWRGRPSITTATQGQLMKVNKWEPNENLMMGAYVEPTEVKGELIQGDLSPLPNQRKYGEVMGRVKPSTRAGRRK